MTTTVGARTRRWRDDGVMSDIHQCPFCELRFVNLSELKFHIEIDHPDRHVPDRDH